MFYPVSTLPGWMQLIGHLLPPSYVFEGMRAVVAGNGVSMTQLSAGLGLAIMYIVAAVWAFGAVHRHAVRSGLLARYSAESVA